MPIFWENKKKHFKVLSAEFFTQHAKHTVDKGDNQLVLQV